MTQHTKDTPLVNNETNNRFELTIDGHTAFVDYQHHADYLELTHTEVPDALSGRGLGKILAEKVFRYLEQEKKKAKVSCSFLAKFLERHPEWQGVIV